MIAKLVALVTKADGCWKALVEAYKEEYRVEDVIFLISKRYHEVFVEPREEIVEGQVQDENRMHILTWEDGMDETIRIYEKLELW